MMTEIVGCDGAGGGGGGELAKGIPESGESVSGNVDGIRIDVYRPVVSIGGSISIVGTHQC